MGLAHEMVVDATMSASIRCHGMKDIPEIPKRHALPASKESLSAAERDVAWMASIAKQQDANALTELFQVYAPKLKGWLMARGVSSGTAEDIVQDVILKVWTRAGQFDPAKASFATWVYRMTRNVWIDHKRKHGRMDVRDPELMKVIADDTVVSAETGFIMSEEANVLRETIKTLPDVQRRTLQMAYMEYKTHKEIADETGVPLGTVKTRIRGAISTLRKKIKDGSPS